MPLSKAFLVRKIKKILHTCSIITYERRNYNKVGLTVFGCIYREGSFCKEGVLSLGRVRVL